MIDEHFTQVGKTSKMPNGGVKNILEYKLSRYACYLIVQNLELIKRKESWLYINKLKNYDKTVFENIKHIDDNGNEFWFARELMSLLEYSKRERFSNAIDNAKNRVKIAVIMLRIIFPRSGKW